ncbi:Trafficking protein Mon1 [Nakaseomyces glabratus]
MLSRKSSNWLLNVPSQSEATTSVNLQSTEVGSITHTSSDDNIATPQDGIDHIDNDRSSSRAENIDMTASMVSHSRSLASLRPVMSSNFQNESDHIDDSLEFDLMRSLNESIYSTDGAISKPFMINEMPQIFDKNSNEDITKNFFIFTSAGKPVYSMYENDKFSASYIGLLTSIISFFQTSNEDNIKTFTSKESNITFVFCNKDPIFYVAMSRCRDESRDELEAQLHFLHSFVLSTLTSKQLTKLFQKRDNFDLRSHLESTDFETLSEICSNFTDKLYPEFSLNSLQCLKLKKPIRAKIHSIMSSQLNKMEDFPRGTLLYSFIIASNNRLCNVLRPKSHTLHPVDLQILFLVIATQFHNLESDKELWIPICFPKFNSNGYLYCYIRTIMNPGDKSSSKFLGHPPVLVAISGQKDAFFKMKSYCDELMVKLTRNNEIIRELRTSILQPYSITDIPAPLVHHFMFKSSKHIQFTMPQLSTSASEPEQRALYERKLKFYYKSLQNSIAQEIASQSNKSLVNFVQWSEPAKSNSEETTDHDSFIEEPVNMLGMVWCSPRFELLLLFNNGIVTRKQALSSARRIVRWCVSNESSLFINEGATF